MNQSVSPYTEKNSSLINAIVFAGLVAGTLDICSACLSTYLRAGLPPAFILKYVASGALGKEALAGGVGVALIGLAIHLVIAYSWTILFFLLYPRISFLRTNTIFVGIVYGAIVWCGMNLLVLPLTRVPQGTIKVTQAIIGMAILMVAVGLPVSFFAKRFYSRKGI